MLAFQVTHTALVNENVLARIRTLSPTPFRALVAELLLFFRETYREVGSLLHHAENIEEMLLFLNK